MFKSKAVAESEKSMQKTDELLCAMIAFDRGDAKRIQHFLKVHSFARLIGLQEKLDEQTQLTLETAALIHDIGIHAAEAKYGQCSGDLQEQEGPPIARKLLTQLHYAPEMIERVCFLVGHHHTYTDVDGADYRILLEADALVNLYEDGVSSQGIRTAYARVFQTPSGRSLCQTMFAVIADDV